MPDTNLLNDDFLKKLRILKLMVRRLIGAGSEGERISRKRGGNIEFKDYRKYALGDEPRYIDWNLFGRTERLYIKEFAKEDAFPIYILLDQTSSMQPLSDRGRAKAVARLTQTTTKTIEKTLSAKFIRARQLAAALGYVGMVAGHPTRVIGFSWSETGAELNLSPLFRRESEVMELLKYLERLTTGGQTNLAAVLKELHEKLRTRGLLILISDLFDLSYLDPQPSFAVPKPSIGQLRSGVGQHTLDKRHLDNPRRALLRFRARGFEISLMHVLAQSEEDPPFRGWVTLRDAETNEGQLTFASDDTLNDYRALLNQFAEDWRRFCLKHSLKYFYANDSIPLEKIIFDFLRRGGLLR